MCLLFESIRVVDGIPRHLNLHTERMNRSRRTLFGCSDIIDLHEVLSGTSVPSHGVYKCRVTYGRKMGDVEFVPYRLRCVKSLILVRDDAISYEHKFIDRSALERHSTGKDEEEAVIVRKGLITDATMANVVFFDGHDWITPSTPLLRGIQREFLISEGAIREEPLRVEDLNRFRSAVLINAMMEIDSGCVIERRNFQFDIS